MLTGGHLKEAFPCWKNTRLLVVFCSMDTRVTISAIPLPTGKMVYFQEFCAKLKAKIHGKREECLAPKTASKSYLRRILDRFKPNGHPKEGAVVAVIPLYPERPKRQETQDTLQTRGTSDTSETAESPESPETRDTNAYRPLLSRRQRPSSLLVEPPRSSCGSISCNSVFGDSPPWRNLPYELIYHIASYVNLSTRMCWALSCKDMMHIIGTPVLFEAIKIDTKERKRLFRRLDKDLPDHIMCNFCNVFHRADLERLEREINHNERSKCTRQLPPFTHRAFETPFFSQRFSYPIFQLAMKRDRRGLDCRQQLALLSYSTVRNFGAFHWQARAEARIVDGQMLYCLQTWYVWNENDVPSDPEVTANLHDIFANSGEKSVVVLPYPDRFPLCIHKNLTAVDPRIEHAIYEPQSLPHWREFPRDMICFEHWPVDECMRCCFCGVEWQVDIQRESTEQKSVCITQWMDLGSCSKMDGTDWTLKAIYDRSLTQRNRADGMQWIKTRFGPAPSVKLPHPESLVGLMPGTWDSSCTKCMWKMEGAPVGNSSMFIHSCHGHPFA